MMFSTKFDILYFIGCQMPGTVLHSACSTSTDLFERSLQLAARLPMGTNTKMQINPLTLKKIGSAA